MKSSYWSEHLRSYSRISTLHIFTLCAFAGPAVIYGFLGNYPEFFVAHRSTRFEIILLTLVLSLGIPILVDAGLRLALRLGVKVRLTFELISQTLLWGLIFMPFLKQLEIDWGWLNFAVALVAGAAMTAAYQSYIPARTFLTVLSPTVIVFPFLFLFASGVTPFLIGGKLALSEGVIDENPVPVVVLIFDELPLASLLNGNLEINQYRYPNLARLAKHSYVFRNATTVAATTVRSVPAILSGREPTAESSPLTTKELPNNLFSLLGTHGYHLIANESVTWLCPNHFCKGSVDRAWHLNLLFGDITVVYLHLLLPQSLVSEIPAIDETAPPFAKRGAIGIIARVLGFSMSEFQRPRTPVIVSSLVSQIDSKFQQSLLFAHLGVPHIPWKFMPSGKEYNPNGVLPPGMTGKFWANDEWPLIQGYQRHLLQVGYVDNIVGQIVGKLLRLDLYDKALIVITADHGVSFVSGAHRRLGTEGTRMDIANVPLLIKLPGQKEMVIDDEDIRTVDILPSIIDALEIDTDWRFDGQSVFNSNLTERGIKSMMLPSGEKIALDVSSIPRLSENVYRKIDIFGTGEDSQSIFQIGPRQELIGEQVQTLQNTLSEMPSFTSIRLDESRAFEYINLGGSYMPTYITGKLRWNDVAGKIDSLAVSVNGIIRATTRTYNQTENGSDFSFMVPENSFEQGYNRIEIYNIDTESH